MADLQTITNPNDIIDVGLLNYFEGKIAAKYQTQNLSAAISGLSATTVEGALTEILGKVTSLPSAIVPKGTRTFSQLAPATDLVAGKVGWMWNISDGFTTTADFVEGAGKVIPAGANIYVVNNGTEATPSYKYDIFAGMYDLSIFKTIDSLKSKGAANKGVYFDADGNAQAMTYELNKSVPSDAVFTDTTYESLTAAEEGTDVSLVTTGEKYAWNHIADGKADKVSNAVAGNFAGLDANGNLTDSGSKASDFATAAQGTKADSAIQSVKVNGTALTPDSNKAVDVLIAEGTNNGTVKVNGTDVAVHGLANTAFRKVASTTDIDEIFA